MDRSSNPALRDELFDAGEGTGPSGPMTLRGTIDKTFVLLILAIASAVLTWNYLPADAIPIILGSVIVAFVVGFITSFHTTLSPFTAPVFAILEGIFLGAFSGWMETLYPGIVAQAVALTFGVFFLLLLVFRARLIRVTEKFRLIVIGATGAIALFYIAGIVLSFVGLPLSFINEGGWLGIVFSIIVAVVASFSLVLDFDYVEQGVANGLPKRHEWYAAFTLLVTLVWLYLEIIRLLMKLRMIQKAVRP
ncbi:Bax inhibitor-1/YccA family protein [Methanoregula sp.]|uniref:Bax inhibitor-1/YccA family protein n=1 Tax=Methanoregula sp. TaxID=2052170 RepID=UPI003567DEBE